jgi:hypothetical protein
LARTVCFTCWHLHDICYPRLHGNKVEAHEVDEIIIGKGACQPPRALLLKDRKEVPFPSPDCSSPPNYITGFCSIDIK